MTNRAARAGIARGYELDDAVRRVNELVRELRVEVRRRRYASGTGIADTGGNFSATDVEGALAELAAALNAAAGGVPAIDRAAGAASVNSPGAAAGFAIVQASPPVRNTLASSLVLTLPAAPTPGNTLIVWHVTRAAPTPTGPTGWTAHPQGTVRASAANGMHGGFFYHVVESGDSATVESHNSSGAQSAAFVVEVSGIGAVVDDYELGDTSTSTPSATLSPTSAALVIAGAVIRVSDPVGGGVTPDANTTELFDFLTNPTNPSSPLGWAGYRSVAGAGTYDVGGTNNIGSQDTGVQGLAFESAAAPWNVPAPNVHDGDDATYEEIDGSNVLLVDLGDDYHIVRTRLLIGSEFAGDKTYTIRGSVDPSFDPDLSEVLATLEWTATGGFTADEVEAEWAFGTAYRYFELTGDDEVRRVYSWELYEAPFSFSVDHGDLTGLADVGDHPAAAISAADAGGWFTGTTVEAHLQELAAKAVGYLPHGAMGAAETFDAAIGWHSGTFDDDCTFTLTAAPTGTVSSLFLELAQDGVGGHLMTLPASVVNRVALEAAQDTTASTTAFLVLLSRDGGTIWFGGWWGGPAAGGSAIEALDEGASLTAALESINFAGAGVSASAVGDAVTVTIPGVTEAAVRDAGRWEPVVTDGELLLMDDDVVMMWIGG